MSAARASLARPVKEVVTSFASPDAWERLTALMTARLILENGDELSPQIFDEAAKLLRDSDDDCRWQAAIVLGVFIDEDPERVWNAVEEFGPTADPDLQEILWTTLMEHLLDQHHSRFKLRAQGLAKQSPVFAHILEMSWRFGRFRRRCR